MLIRKVASGTAFAGTIAMSLWASAAPAMEPVREDAKYAPIQSIRYDFGSKSMSGYFVEQAKKCIVMLMVYEKRDPDADSSSTAGPTTSGLAQAESSKSSFCQWFRFVFLRRSMRSMKPRAQ